MRRPHGSLGGWEIDSTDARYGYAQLLVVLSPLDSTVVPVGSPAAASRARAVVGAFKGDTGELAWKRVIRAADLPTGSAFSLFSSRPRQMGTLPPLVTVMAVDAATHRPTLWQVNGLNGELEGSPTTLDAPYKVRVS